MKRSLVLIVVALLLIPAPLLVAPKTAHALFGIGDIVLDPANLVKNTITSVVSGLVSNATNALVVKEYVLDTIAWQVSQRSIQSMTGSVVNFVNGKTNGTGRPQYVQNLRGDLQGVGDNQAFAFFAQFSSQSNSPFAGAIVSSLRSNYLQETSLGGFFASNQCSLSRYSPNQNQFLSGDWTQGGAAAWFALTTQNQNNPYTLHQSSQSALSGVISDARGARFADYSNGNGFISWCDPEKDTSADLFQQIPEQQCNKKDGTPGLVQTPGSVIGARLNNQFDANVSRVVIGNELNQVIGNLAFGLVTNVLGGSSGGLFGISNSSSGRSAYLDQYQNESVSGSSSGMDAVSIAQTALSNVAAYEAAWGTIRDAASTTAETLTELAQSCVVHKSSADIALSSEVAPVLNRARTALSSAESTRTLALRVQAGANANTPGASGALLADIQALAAAPPTASDVVQAQSDAQAFGAATSTPSGSLTVSNGSLLDQMNLISANAETLKLSCSLSPL